MWYNTTMIKTATEMTKQTERLHKSCIKLGVDFPDNFFSKEDELQTVIRWSKSSDKPSEDLVTSKLRELGCFTTIKPKGINFNF